MEDRWITSVGIDLGTSTTKMIISRLRLGKRSGSFMLPRVVIAERVLMYSSPLYETPFKNPDEIDMERVFAILQHEYDQAGFQLADIKSGAVIITGETANKRNAQQIVHKLAERAGDFVVATAGADLEAVLAGRGSGALARSTHIRGTVANIDIGGGTANTVLFHRGKILGTWTFHVGGRLIRLNAQGEILQVSASLKPWLAANQYSLQTGMRITLDELQRILSRMARDMLAFLAGKGRSAAANRLILGEPSETVPPIDELMISGGIGHLLDQPEPLQLRQAAAYEDIGPLLAHTLKQELELGNYPFHLISPQETVRATVIGAGMQSTEISGATVHVDPALLPIRNLPVLKLELTELILSDAEHLKPALIDAMELGRTLFEQASSPPLATDHAAPLFALSITGLSYCSYASLQVLADQLIHAYKHYFPHSTIMVILCENDMAKALGQSLSKRCRGLPKVLCIDQVTVDYGDYIDLGIPIKPYSEPMIPVVIKTLAFANPTV